MIVLVVVFLILNLMACVVNVIYGHYVIAALALGSAICLFLIERNTK